MPATSGVNVGFLIVVSDSVAVDPGGVVRVHWCMYVPVPPDSNTSRLTRVPVVPVVGAAIDADRGFLAATVTCGAFAVVPDESVTVRSS